MKTLMAEIKVAQLLRVLINITMPQWSVDITVQVFDPDVLAFLVPR